MVATLAAGLVTAVLAQLLCGFFAMMVVGPIFCLASGAAQSAVLSQYTRRFARVHWWEWGAFTSIFGLCGWLSGIALQVTVGRSVLLDGSDALLLSVGDQAIFLLWGMLTGLMAGLGQALIFTWKFRLVLGPWSFGSTWKAGASWVAVSAVSWAVGLGLNGLVFAAVTPSVISAIPDYVFPERPLWIFVAQMVSILLLSLPISAGTGATLAWLLRHPDTRASHTGRLISKKVN